MRIKPSLRPSSPLAGVAGACVALATSLIIRLNAAEAAADLSIRVEETRLVVTRAEGTPLPDRAIPGVELTIGDPAAGGYVARINAVGPDPYTPDAPLMLYDVSFRNAATGQWEPLCHPGPHGLALAVPIPGTWSADGRYRPLPPNQFSFTCTAGAHVKCLRLGYRPWKRTSAGASLAPYHQACTRMMRADYCGNGTPNTVAGKQVQVWDDTGLHPKSTQAYGRFEAIWGVEGAVCVRRARVPKSYPRERILRACPGLASRFGDICTPDLLQQYPEALLANRS
jgi:hypothetical protein